MNFILNFILRDFVPVPSEQNVLAALQFGFSWPHSLVVIRNFVESGPRRVVRHLLNILF